MTNLEPSDTIKTKMGKTQATYKNENLILSVKEVLFRTNGKGRVYPVIVFNQTKELKARETDAIIFDNIGTLLANKVGKGSRLKINFDEDNKPSVMAILKEWDNEVVVPKDCNVCDRPYERLDSGECVCSYHYCPATDRGFLFKLFKLGVPEIPVSYIKDFLDKFPISDSSGSIDSIAEFRYLWDTIKFRGTQAREAKWIELHPARGHMLYKYENELDAFLKSTEIKSSWFWHICNFPRISEDVFHEICSLNPRKMMDGEIKHAYQKLSKEARKYIETNFDFIEWLLKFFEASGPKEWTA